MKNLRRESVLLFLLYLIVAIGLTFLAIRKQKRGTEPFPAEPKENEKHSDRLGPNELFYLDRNYPEADARPDLYRERLKQAIAYDKSSKKSNRGLNYPWTIQGPGNIGGRVNTIAVHPVDPNIILLGYSQGGIYRTEDGGSHWSPVFDDQASLAIGHISFDAQNPDLVWAATGDVNISGYPFIGAGVYRSLDRGKTWANRGLDDLGVLSKVVVDPNASNIIYVGSMGFPSHKGNERGLFRSVDNGATWQKTLNIDDSTGVIDLVTDPFKAGRVFASSWTRVRSSTIGTTLGPGTGLYKSEDYGATWTNVTNGLPNGEHSRTGVEITNDGTLFMSYIGDIPGGECAGYVETLQNIYKSIDGGISWDSIPTAPEFGVYCDLFGQFGWYFETLKVNPENPNDMFLLGIDIIRSLDGGQSWFDAGPPWWQYSVHADKHDLVFAHGDIYLGTDGGAYKTDLNQNSDWVDIENIPSSQFYRTIWNPHMPDQYFGGAQDNGTTGGNETFINDWPRIIGGDGFQPLYDPGEPDWMYAETQNGAVYFSDDGGFNFIDLVEGLYGSRYWDMPLVMNHHEPKILYCGSERMFRIDMRDTLREWTPISEDLTRGDSILGGRYPGITAIAQSELDSLRLYAGTQDGLIWTSPDGGVTWANITDGTPGFYVTSITCSSKNNLGVVATYSGYRDDDHHPYIYRSEDAGATWEPVASDLPMMGVNSFYILPGWDDAVMFAGTDGGVYVTSDAGQSWDRLGSEMPYMPVYDLDYNPVENTLIAATFSRGIMTFPIEELDLVSSIHNVISNALSGVSIYPTLVSDYFSINCSLYKGIEHTMNIDLVNASGKSIEQSQYEVNESINQDIYFGKENPPGLYFVSVRIANETSVFKIIRL